QEADEGAAVPEDGQRRLGQRRPVGAGSGVGLRLAQRTALDRDEARAEALEAGVVLVARGLVDATLAPEYRLDRLDRHAGRPRAAVAATPADEFVDEHPARRVGIAGLAVDDALAAPALLGGAGLVVDEHGAAGCLAQALLHELEVIAMEDLDAGERATPLVALGLVGDDDDA